MTTVRIAQAPRAVRIVRLEFSNAGPPPAGRHRDSKITLKHVPTRPLTQEGLDFSSDVNSQYVVLLAF